MGDAAKRLKKNNESLVGRITGLDPAQPCFELEDVRVRLDKTDAKFVDIVHTNARLVIPTFGFGIISPIGHVDYYMNGGTNQPGCIINSLPKHIRSIFDIYRMSVEDVLNIVGCSHIRAAQYFTSSLVNDKCYLIGRKISSFELILMLATLGIVSAFVNTFVKVGSPCNNESCIIMGLNIENTPTEGTFAVKTGFKEPYCETSGVFTELKKKAQQLRKSILSLTRLNKYF